MGLLFHQAYDLKLPWQQLLWESGATATGVSIQCLLLFGLQQRQVVSLPILPRLSLSDPRLVTCSYPFARVWYALDTPTLVHPGTFGIGYACLCCNVVTKHADWAIQDALCMQPLQQHAGQCARSFG